MKITIKGYPFLIDKEDYKLISIYSWRILHGPNTYYGQGYRYGRKRILMHNLIIGKHPTLDVDHIDRNGWNNQKSNLRFVTRSMNNFNSVALPSHNRSGIKGVCWYPNYQMWRAFIGINGKQITLGYFEALEEAMQARKTAEEKLHK